MAAFQLHFNIKLKSMDNPNDPDSAELYQAQLESYRTQIEGILTPLSQLLAPLPNNDKLMRHKISINFLLDNLEKKKGIFTNAYVDIQLHPELWAKTSRIGRSSIMGIESESTYSALKKQLSNLLKTTSRFRSADSALREKLNEALDKLDRLQTKENTLLLERMRSDTADWLLEKIATMNGNQKEDLKNRINEIKNLTEDKLQTSTDCLIYSKKVNSLRKDLLKFSKEKENENAKINLAEFEKLSLQLSIVTKLEIDPLYDRSPTWSRMTSFEKARMIAKIVSVNIAALCAIGAVISLFVFPPATPFFMLAGMVGMLPLLDTIFEVGRTLWYGRSPTKKQIGELGFAFPIMAALMFGAHGIVALGSAIINTAPQVGYNLMVAGAIIAKKCMGGINLAMNSGFSALNWFGFKKSNEPKTVQDLHDQTDYKKAPDLKKLSKILQNSASISQSTISIGQLLKSKAKESEDGLYYLGKNGNTYTVSKSELENIALWDKGFFSLKSPSRFAQDIQQSVNEYCSLPHGVSVEIKLQKISEIKTYIMKWKNDIDVTEKRTSKRSSYVDKLKTYLTLEEKTLNKIKEDKASVFLFKYRK